MDMDSEKDKLLDEIEAEVTVQYTQKDYYQVIDLLIYLLLLNLLIQEIDLCGDQTLRR
ncbi:MAG: hypothetical protein WA421_19440 [Nitrososphaeraceae archaeon]